MVRRRVGAGVGQFWRQFQAFALRGNLVDLAVAVIIGGAFNKIITSLVEDLVMPLINPLIPGGDWRTLTIGPGVKIGHFLGAVVDFFIVALVLFWSVRLVLLARRPSPTSAPPEPTTEERLVQAIERLNEHLDRRLG